MPLARDLSWQNIKNAASGKLHGSGASKQTASAEEPRDDKATTTSLRPPSQSHIGSSSSSSSDEPPRGQTSGTHLTVPGSTSRVSTPVPSSNTTPSSTAASSSYSSVQTQINKTANSNAPLAVLRVQVLRATDLSPKDRNGKADPFVTVSIPGLAVLARRNGSQSNNLEQRLRKQTSVVSKNLNPEWKDEVFDFDITQDWLGPEGWQEDDGAGDDLPSKLESTDIADAVSEVTESPAQHSGVATPATDASGPTSRPPSRRKLSETASKVLHTSAKGMMLLPKGAAAGARVVARGAPRPMRLRKAGPSGARRLAGSRAGFVSNLEIVVWDKDFARREYMGEVSWPVWEWCRGARAVAWDEQDPQALEPAWLSLVSSRQNTQVSGKVQIRIGLVAVPGSPVKSLDRLYRSLVASAVGAGKSVRDEIPGGPQAAPTEDEIMAGVRAIPAAQSVGTAENFFADDGFSSDSDEDEPEEILDSEVESDSDDDDDDDDDDLTSETDTDAMISGEEEGFGTDAEDQGAPNLLARHRQRVSSRQESDEQILTGSSTGFSSPSEQIGTPASFRDSQNKRRLFPNLGRKSGRNRQASDSADAVLPPGEGQSRFVGRRNLKGKIIKKRRPKHRLPRIEGETKEERKERKRQSRASRRRQTQDARTAKKEQRLAEQDYSFQAGGDIIGIVMMEVKEARDLPRWKNSLRTGFDMDPFAIVAFGQKIFRTRVLRHTLNPAWNEKLLFHVRPHEMNFSVKLSVYDWDKISANDHVGACELPLGTLLDAAPKPNAETGLYSTEGDVINQMQTFHLPLTRASKDEEVKYGSSSPTVTVQAKFTPYAALRQRFWRQLCQQFDTNDSESMSALELTAMLDSLGSTLTTETIHSFFTRYGKNPENEAITFDEAILALESEVKKPSTEKRRVRSSSGSPGVEEGRAATPALTSLDVQEGGNVEGALDLSGPSAPVNVAQTDASSEKVSAPVSSADAAQEAAVTAEPSVKPVTASSAVAHAVSTSSEDAPNPATTPLSQSSVEDSRVTSPDLEQRPVERVILLKSCPLCHMPRLSKKGDGDVVTHLAICASQDWRRVDSLVVGNFVTASQAHRKWFNKIVITATQGRYKLGANSSNIIVQDRETGELLEEKMQVYVRLGIRLLYQGARSRMEGARVRRMLQNMSYKQGRKYDSPASAREIPGFIAFHNLDVDEIRDPLDSFKTFNEFFYRKLKPDARPVDEPDNPRRLVSAADCRLMVFENIDAATKLWIKGREFSVERLLGERFADKVEQYKNGSLCIFRLAPQDYHRFHCPADGVVGEPFTIEGSYYTVNPVAIRSAIDVYCENVRVVVPLHTKDFGTIYTVHIGAMLVGSIKITVTAGQTIKRGDELGYYAFGGSTTILVFEKNRLEWDEDIAMNSNASIETLIKQGRGIGRAVETED